MESCGKVQKVNEFGSIGTTWLLLLLLLLTVDEKQYYTFPC